MISGKSTDKMSYYSLLISGSAALIGSVYYLYSLYKEETEEDLDESGKKSNKISNLPEHKYLKKQKKSTNYFLELKSKVQLTSEEIAALISREVEVELELEEPYFREQRIHWLNNNDEEKYQELVIKCYQNKHKILERAKKRYKIRYPIMSHSIDLLFSSGGHSQCEKLLFKIYTPKFSNNVLPSYKTTREAVLSHCKNIVDSYKEFSININSKISITNKDEVNEQKLQLVILRSKLDDKLYIQNGITMTQLLFMVYLHKLERDYEVKNALSSIGR
jgi:hypothetical protein